MGGGDVERVIERKSMHLKRKVKKCKIKDNNRKMAKNTEYWSLLVLFFYPPPLSQIVNKTRRQKTILFLCMFLWNICKYIDYCENRRMTCSQFKNCISDHLAPFSFHSLTLCVFSFSFLLSYSLDCWRNLFPTKKKK